MMNSNKIYSIAFLASIGCSSGFGPISEAFQEKEYYDEDSEQSDFFSQAGLPDLRGQMDETFCNDVQPGAYGASSYFLGTYIIEGDSWIGKERWYLFPTPEWAEAEDEITEEGCYVTWEMIAEEEDCIDCDIGLEVFAGVNRRDTNCPEGLWDNPEEEEWTARYKVDINGENAAFYFQESDNFLGEGYTNSNVNALSFLTEASCTWF